MEKKKHQTQTPKQIREVTLFVVFHIIRDNQGKRKEKKKLILTKNEEEQDKEQRSLQYSLK
jgi:hypothetical protein